MKNIDHALKFTGKSGANYKFYIYPLPSFFSDRHGAIYLFIKLLDNNFHVPIYLGTTEDLRTLFTNYDEIKEAYDSEPTHICICIEDDGSKREFAEEDLSDIAQTHLDFQIQ